MDHLAPGPIKPPVWPVSPTVSIGDQTDRLIGLLVSTVCFRLPRGESLRAEGENAGREATAGFLPQWVFVARAGPKATRYQAR